MMLVTSNVNYVSVSAAGGFRAPCGTPCCGWPASTAARGNEGDPLIAAPSTGKGTTVSDATTTEFDELFASFDITDMGVLEINEGVALPEMGASDGNWACCSSSSSSSSSCC